MQIQYFGWSGITIQHGSVLVGFDLFGDAVTWQAVGGAAATILCATHGHPEHCGSLRQFVRAPEAHSRSGSIHLVSSPPVVNYLNKGGTLPERNTHPLTNAQRVRIADVQITAFGWRHLPLLPPGILPKFEYAAHLLSRPFDFIRIGMSSLRLPANAPTLGFHLRFDDGLTVLNYAEGLHRLTDIREVEWVARTLPADVLLFAVEPEDVDAIPRWLEMLRPSEVFLYEAHRPWRELFRLPYLNLNAYAEHLSALFRQTRFDTLVQPGQLIA